MFEIHERKLVDCTLETLLESRRAVIGVIGLGYVGLPLITAFAHAGFRTIGFDVNREHVTTLNQGVCPITDVDANLFRHLVETKQLQVTEHFAHLAEVDVVCICVPTPLQKSRDPDMSYIVRAVEQVAHYLHPQMLVVLESTTYPGTTEELVLPMLEHRGLQVERDFYLAFSPERIDPGNRHFHLENTPKVVGGVGEESTRLAAILYNSVTARAIPVSTPRAAELVKLLENTYRAVNIGLANEFAQIAAMLQIDIWEVIEAAATKPFGFVPFYPGPGLGGHCIPLDPHYLAWRLRALHYKARFIETASEVNDEMPSFVVELAAQALNEQGKCLNGAHILLLGVAYKRDISDARESPALDIIKELQRSHASITYADPFVPTLHFEHSILYAAPLSDEALHNADCVIILADHTTFDYAYIVQESRLVIDTRNATRHLNDAAHVWRLQRPTGIVGREEPLSIHEEIFRKRAS